VFHLGGRWEPLPTTARQHSGKKRRSGTSVTPAKMARNQKMACQPRYWLRRPPMMGPKAGPSSAPQFAQPIHVPRSEDVAMSATTALARATVPLLPEL